MTWRWEIRKEEKSRWLSSSKRDSSPWRMAVSQMIRPTKTKSPAQSPRPKLKEPRLRFLLIFLWNLMLPATKYHHKIPKEFLSSRINRTRESKRRLMPGRLSMVSSLLSFSSSMINLTHHFKFKNVSLMLLSNLSKLRGPVCKCLYLTRSWSLKWQSENATS